MRFIDENWRRAFWGAESKEKFSKLNLVWRIFNLVKFLFIQAQKSTRNPQFFLISRVEKRLNFGSSEAIRQLFLSDKSHKTFLVHYGDFSRGLKIIFNDNEWSRDALFLWLPFISSVSYCFKWVRWIAGNCVFMVQLESFFMASLKALSH